MNKNVIQGKWTEIKGEVRKAWGRLTDDELEKTKGDLTAIRGLIQQKYGKTQDDSGKKLSGIFSRFVEKKDDVFESSKKRLKH